LPPYDELLAVFEGRERKIKNENKEFIIEEKIDLKKIESNSFEWKSLLLTERVYSESI